MDQLAFSQEGGYLFITEYSQTSPILVNLSTGAWLDQQPPDLQLVGIGSYRIVRVGAEVQVQNPTGEIVARRTVRDENTDMVTSPWQDWLLIHEADDYTVWNWRTQQLFTIPLKILHHSYSNGSAKTAFSPDESRLVIFKDELVQLYDLATGELVQTIPDYLPEDEFIFTPNSQYFYRVSPDGRLTLFDSATGSERYSIENRLYGRQALVFSSDSQRVITHSYDDYDYAPLVRDVETGATLFSLPRHTAQVVSTVFYPDDSRIITTTTKSSGTVWDAKTGEPLFTLPAYANHVEAISPDGQWFITQGNELPNENWGGGGSFYVAIWDAHNGELQRLQIIGVPGDGLHKFAIDGSFTRFAIAAVYTDTIDIFDMDVQLFIAEACRKISPQRDFLPEERRKFNIPDNAPTCPDFV